jgi:hypothetical protein
MADSHDLVLYRTAVLMILSKCAAAFISIKTV